MLGLIILGEKCAGKRSAGNPHAAFDVAGAGNGATASRTEARFSKGDCRSPWGLETQPWQFDRDCGDCRAGILEGWRQISTPWGPKIGRVRLGFEYFSV